MDSIEQFDWDWSPDECVIHDLDLVACRRDCQAEGCHGVQHWLATFQEWKCDVCGRVDTGRDHDLKSSPPVERQLLERGVFLDGQALEEC